ncbi:octopamine receptor beta-2R-like isoform X2 [Panonychus citri]|uniref:octopamine receptor beta-2R-like isoform X2 n=1 Tax=Panonychus citri TaxID=50023 RepID=UPI0023080156|nr:octopamine receptor beta-2R-like isoform X2 [Panonychus citri]
MGYCDNYTYLLPAEYIENLFPSNYSNQTVDSDFEHSQLATLYIYFCPILIVACFSSILLNGVLIKGIQLNRCILLTIEVIRLTSLFASVLHLLALTWLHYQGTVNPIHHRLTSLYQRSENIKYVTLTCWLIPFIIFIFIFSSTSCQGYRSQDCDFTFLLGWHFRSTILLLFGTPWLLMIVAYLHIFWTLEMAQKLTCSLNNNNSKQINNNSNNLNVNNSNNNNTLVNNNPINITNNTNLTRRIDKSYRKAITTSLIIIITYLIGWMPAIIWYAISCIDGCPYPLYSQTSSTRAYLGFITTGSVVAKPIVDPLIYSYRYREVRMAIQELFCPNYRFSHNINNSNITDNNNTLNSFTHRFQRNTDETEMVTTTS